MTNEELMARVKTMSLEELHRYRSVVVGADRVISFAGISIILSILFFLNIFTVIGGGFLVMMFAKTSTSLDRTVEIVDDRISIVADK